MEKDKISLIKSVIKSCDRTPDGNIKPEARERVLQTMKEYLQHAGRLNISELSAWLGLSRQTVKNLTNEILDWWREEGQNQFLVQSKWLESVLRDMDNNPGTFDKDKIAITKLKAMLFDKTNALQKLLLKESLSNISLVFVKTDKPRELLDDKSASIKIENKSDKNN